jgi:exodeoxyribonuclease V alpha subunit
MNVDSEKRPSAWSRDSRAPSPSQPAGTGTPRARKNVEVAGGEVEEITGAVESVVYRSDDTGYTVCSIKVPGRQDALTVVGNCAAIWVGETLRATGRWARHRQHGLQFQAESMTCVVPTSARGIERYLASGMIRGVGKVMAKRLVGAFGDETLKIIEKESARLEEVDGVGPVRRKMIKESWIQQKAVRDIMIFLQSHGVGVAHSARIYREYGNQAIAIIQENPYRLCRDIWGIGFKTADSVAMSVGVPRESDVRARAGLVHVLQTLTDEGHCYCPTAELVLQAQALLEISPEILTTALDHELKLGTLVNDEGRIYLAGLHQAETGIAERIRALIEHEPGFRPIVVEKALPWAERKIELQFAPKQADALSMALQNKVSIITGGPGVGKTTIIRALVDIFGARELTLQLAAPTGRAAKRMEEATGHEALTIHRLLKFTPNTGLFEYGPSNPIESDVFILDEVSMVDTPLMYHFLGALPPASCLVLVGDVDQLPSVGPGNVLRDLIGSGAVPCCKLETIFRQAEGGWIVRNAHHVNHGEGLESPSTNAQSDFYFIESQEPEQVIERLMELVTGRIPRRFQFDPMSDIQVLTPMRRNQLGADNLNGLLQERLNPVGEDIRRYGRIYRMRDRVMQIRNNYDKGVFNGDIGRIRQIDAEEQSLAVDFDGNLVPYEFDELDELVHAYACTIHKSQGSEYPAVVILLTTQHFKLLQRNLLYTAITRGRKLVCLIGSSKAVGMAIRNNETRLRRTGLRERLSLAMNPGRRLEPVEDQ